MQIYLKTVVTAVFAFCRSAVKSRSVYTPRRLIIVADNNCIVLDRGIIVREHRQGRKRIVIRHQ